MNKRPLLIVGAAVGSLAAAFAIKKLMECPVVRERFGLESKESAAEIERGIEAAMANLATESPAPSP